jgi:ATP-binding cassette subfamily B (MDR/TAP) protein 1
MLKDRKNKSAHEISAQVACEAVASIRTVASLTREEDCLHLYSASLEEPLMKSNKTSLWSNMLYALSQSVQFYVIALVFWYGSTLVASLEITITAFFVVFMVRRVDSANSKCQPMVL